MTFDNRREPIAIIGMSCRFPGADGVEAFWEMLVEGREALSEVPPERFDIDRYYDPRPEQSGKIVSRRGGFLDEIRRFDAPLFGISGREADAMDPQQRLLLEVAFEALEDGGQVIERLEGTDTGVFVGMVANEYRRRALAEDVEMDVYTGAGTSRAAVAGRLSHAFGLNGPSLTLDTACSSSLVAVDLACESLRSGEAQMAVAGGTNLILEPEASIGFSRTGMLAADGRCKFGDASADGFVRSDGVGAIVLKPLSAALRDGDRVRSVIWESTSNNDGRSGKGFFLTPSREGQRDLLEKVYARRDGLRARIDYIESHGTGTPTGDPVELGALSDVLVDGVERRGPLYAGSVKTNIGHTEGAAGMAGLIKAALVCERREIPPSLNFEEPNPEIPWKDLGIEIPRERTELSGERPPIAGVSAFGITGTNAHVLLAGWEPARRRRDPERRSVHILPISAHTDEALVEYERRYAEHLGSESPGGEADLHRLCAAAARHRTHRRWRLAVAAEDREAMHDRLERLARRSERERLGAGQRLEHTRMGFVCAGQGGQWAGMGRRLLEEPEASRVLERCDRVFERVAEWSPIEVLRGEDGWMDDVGRIQPLLFVTQVALGEMWRARGFAPAAVVGHSLGEVAAAHLAGALSLEDAARVSGTRSEMMREIAGRGALVAVGLGPEEAEQAIARHGFDVSVAVHTSPSSSVLSGDADAIAEVRREFEGREVFCRPIDVDVASHSSQVEPLLEPLHERLAGLTPRPLETPMFSTARGEWLEGSELGPKYWCENLRQSVRLAGAVRELVDEGIDAFVEISPHPVLSQPLAEMLGASDRPKVVLASMRREESPAKVVAEGVCELYERGWEVDWAEVYPDGEPVSLPRYPFGGERHWFEAGSGERSEVAVRHRSAGELDEGTTEHPFLTRHFTLGSEADLRVWETPLTTDRLWYLDEHRVRGTVVLPGSAYVEVAAAVAESLLQGESIAVEAVEFDEILAIPEGGERRLQVIAESLGGEHWRLEFYSFDPETRREEAGRETFHASARVLACQESSGSSAPSVINDTHLASSGQVFSSEEFYAAMHSHGIDDGPAFRAVDVLTYDERRVEGRLRIPAPVLREVDAYLVHPVVLDALFQLVGPLVLEHETDDKTAFLPARIGRAVIHRSPVGEMRGLAVRRETDESGVLLADIRLVDEVGAPVVDIEDFAVRRLDTGTDEERFDGWFHRWEWERNTDFVQLLDVTPEDSEPDGWVVFSESDAQGRRLVEMLEARGRTVVQGTWPAGESGADERAEYLERFRDAAGRSGDLEGVIVLMEGAPLVGEREDGQARVAETLALVRTLDQSDVLGALRLWLVTAGAHDVGESSRVEVGQSAVWGMARVVRNELPRLDVRCADLGREVEEDDLEGLVHGLLVGGRETETAFRDGYRFVRRLRRFEPGSAAAERRHLRREIAGDDQFVLRPGEPSAIDRLRFAPSDRRAPGPREIEIEVRTAGLNFADVLTAMGLVDHGDQEIGGECVGLVERVGSDVGGRFESGMRVMAFAPSANCFGGYATLEADLAVEVPERLTLREAATVPAVYQTAYYALVREANLQPGERVLIHSASGGVGHAALHIARRIGAEIFATAGTDEKRQYLREQFGLEHVMDSRSLEFADEIQAITDGQGIDVVLNTLTGEGTERGFEILRPLGRFLDLSKSDMYENDGLAVEPFEKNLTYVGIDITQVAEHRPGLVAEMWEGIAEGLAAGDYEPIPVDSVFEMRRLREAFRYMQRGVHIGKIVLEKQFECMEVERPVEPETMFRERGAYLLAGGTGGLGLEVAEWMSCRGAGRLVLISRSGISERDAERLDRMRERGTEVGVATGDVTDLERMREIAEEVRGEARIRGVFHLAGVLDDATVGNQTRRRVERVFEPKVRGACVLERVTAEDPLDYFVLFSSAAPTVGSPGQANYAAANAAVDALAVRRRLEGRPADSIGWGEWEEVGLAAADSIRGERLEERGMGAISVEAGLQALERALVSRMPPRYDILDIDWREWGASMPMIRQSETFRHLVEAGGGEKGAGAGGELLEAIERTDGEKRNSLVADYLRGEVSSVLGTSAAKLDFGKSVTRLGLDSLMVVELRVRLEDKLGVELSGDSILAASDLEHLTDKVVEKLDRI